MPIEDEAIGICRVCSRKLTNPKSIEKGIGPVCERKGKLMANRPAVKEALHEAALNNLKTAGILMRRDEAGETITNVPILVIHHSPTGLNYGYAGSGPADMALNILEAVLRIEGYEGPKTVCWKGECFSVAWRWHQKFKLEFITPVRNEGVVISYKKVREWTLSRLRPGDMALEPTH